MHYKNGREANNGDHVVFPNEYGAGVFVGTLYAITRERETCNGMLAYVVPGNVNIHNVNIQWVTICNGFHAEDALAAALEKSRPLSQ